MEIEYRKSVIHQTVGGEDMETEVFLPDFGDGQEQRPIGIWGQRHLRYIREHRIALYSELLTSGRLNAYLADLNEEAEAKLLPKAGDGFKLPSVECQGAFERGHGEIRKACRDYKALSYGSATFPRQGKGVF